MATSVGRCCVWRRWLSAGRPKNAVAELGGVLTGMRAGRHHEPTAGGVSALRKTRLRQPFTSRLMTVGGRVRAARGGSVPIAAMTGEPAHRSTGRTGRRVPTFRNGGGGVSRAV